MKIFVYGTLRKGERNAHHLDGMTCLCENAWTKGVLCDTQRGYPAMFLNESGKSQNVYGEVYDINEDILKVIDTLEGYVPGQKNNLYERITVKVYTDCMEMLDEAITYVSGSSLQYSRDKTIPLGDWRVYTYLGNPELYYFAYGSCMDDERFKIANVHKYFTDVIGRGVLEGYEMKFSRNSTDGGKADITECVKAQTEGIVYMVPEEAIDYLYKREGVYTNMYRPAIVSVFSGGEPYDVLTFIGLDKQPETAPTELYATEIIRGATGILSESYIEQLKSRMGKLI